MTIIKSHLFLICLLLAFGCAARSPVGPDRHPEWLASLIRQLETEPVANPPAYIARYPYKGDTVYYLPPRCCDIWSTLYGPDGAILCHPDGGITGRGDGRCPVFLTERTNEQIVWRDPRATSPRASP